MKDSNTLDVLDDVVVVAQTLGICTQIGIVHTVSVMKQYSPNS
jgi:hypothetical protein